MQNPGKHVDYAGDVIAPLPAGAPRRLFHQGLHAGEIAEPEQHQSDGEEIFGIGRVDFESPLEQVKRLLRILWQSERTLMTQRGGGLV